MSARRRLLLAVVLGTGISASLCFAGCSRVKTHEDMVKETIGVISRQADVLEEIRDDAAAKAALGTLLDLARKTQENEAEWKKMPAPSQDTTLKLRRYRAEMMLAIGRVESESVRLERVLGKDAWKEVSDALGKTLSN